LQATFGNSAGVVTPLDQAASSGGRLGPERPFAHFNEHRPPRALRQRAPLNAAPASDDQVAARVLDLDRVRRRHLLGGLIHEYRLAA
jgi:hypothetical protein